RVGAAARLRGRHGPFESGRPGPGGHHVQAVRAHGLRRARLPFDAQSSARGRERPRHLLLRSREEGAFLRKIRSGAIDAATTLVVALVVALVFAILFHPARVRAAKRTGPAAAKAPVASDPAFGTYWHDG